MGARRPDDAGQAAVPRDGQAVPAVSVPFLRTLLQTVADLPPADLAMLAADVARGAVPCREYWRRVSTGDDAAVRYAVLDLLTRAVGDWGLPDLTWLVGEIRDGRIVGPVRRCELIGSGGTE